jgi:predicted O-methyltransferase YrrM
MIRNLDWATINAQGFFTTKDYVTKKIPTWIPLLEPMRDHPLSILEIGSLEGRSALFFLSYLPNARITCIDPFRKKREGIFDKNLAKYRHRVTKIADFSLPALIRLRQTAAEFDVIYIDGCHERETVMIDSVLCWGMLKLRGLLIWDDYDNGYKKEAPNWERPKSAIDGFLVAYAGEYQEESRHSQVIVRKTIATPRCAVHSSIATLALTRAKQQHGLVLAKRVLREFLSIFYPRRLALKLRIALSNDSQGPNSRCATQCRTRDLPMLGSSYVGGLATHRSGSPSAGPRH